MMDDGTCQKDRETRDLSDSIEGNVHVVIPIHILSIVIYVRAW